MKRILKNEKCRYCEKIITNDDWWVEVLCYDESSLDSHYYYCSIFHMFLKMGLKDRS